MLYLADEMFRNRHKTFTVTFGNLFHGKRLISLKRLLNGRNM
jgi:hypothetical protein